MRFGNDSKAGVTRRDFLTLTTAAAGLGVAAFVQPAEADTPEALPRVASINSVYRYKSHAYHIAGRFIHGYTREGVHHQPPFQLVRMYNDQYPDDDLSREVCRRHKIELCRTVSETLGGDRLDVDGVLLICEHGDYRLNEFGQILYPRYELFQQIVDVFRRSRRSVPVFVDKHLSYDHRRAAEMVATAREMNFGLMAGSSLPVTWRRPELEPPLDTPFTEGLLLYGYDRSIDEIYWFHALESLQCMLERRAGGETGVKSVECLVGPNVWKAGDAGRWSWKLFHAAAGRSPSYNIGDPRENVPTPKAILIDYRDGTRGAVLNLPEQLSDMNFAGTVRGQDEALSTDFYLPAPPGARFFDPLTANIEKFFATGKPPYPVERTLLTSTLLDLALHSLHDGSRKIEADSLDVRYQPPADSGFFRGRYTDAG
ncbi:MAG TPA: twin-arginine translocation signal domain-containing protein [Pirellulales bacterium]|jgi:hypothetical protein|nr:twin-arginine translocation signal domain-containing protein [Pirellulales bacterium]